MKIGEKIRLDDLIKWTSVINITDSSKGPIGPGFISSISTDSRTTEADDLFIPVIGENYDGHDFIIEAAAKGCSGFVFQADHLRGLDRWKNSVDPRIWKKLILLQTENTVDFLLKLAAGYIRRFKLKVIGITGSVGKTTSKDLLVNILSTSFNTKFTPENYNTEIGVARSVLGLDKKTEVFVAELGMRAKGQILKLCEVVDPEIGAITAVSPSHLEFFKDLEEIASAKAEIGEWLKNRGGILFLNDDDEWTDFIINKTKCYFLKFGRNKSLDYSFIEKDCDDFGRYSFDLTLRGKKVSGIKLLIPGFHNIYNACCAAAIASYVGISGAKIKRGLMSTTIEEKRMDIFLKSGKIVINDCYNASPLSMRRAIDTLATVASKNNSRSVAILSDMLELGKDSEKLHYDLGKYIFESKIDILITTGKLSGHIEEGFRHACKKNSLENTGRKKRSYHFKDKESLEASLTDILNKNDAILIKGSRANRLETLIGCI